MKRKSVIVFLTAVILNLSLGTSVLAFRDVPERSPLHAPLQELMERGVIDEGSFFRPDEPIPLQMFLESVFRDNQIELLDIPEETVLPPNLSPVDPFASEVYTAMEKGLINPEKDIDLLAPLSKLKALKAIVTLKKIAPARRVSPEFSEKYLDLLPEATQKSADARYIEAALASKIIRADDVADIEGVLTRKDFVLWLDQYHADGEKRSRLEKDNTFPTQKSSPRIQIIQGDLEENVIKSRAEDSRNYVFPDEFFFERIYKDMLSNYRFIEELTPEKKKELIHGAIEGMVEQLDDKYSNYIIPEKKEEYLESINGNFEGIGAYVEMVDGKFTITAPIAGSPAEKAGIQGGDIVTHVDGESILGNTIRESINMVKGPAGTEVKLTIARNGLRLNIVVTRAEVDIPAVEYQVKRTVPIIHIKNFDQTLTERFRELINEHVVGKDVRGLVIDLRNNPGGFLNGSVELGEFFAEKGELIFSVDYKDKVDEFTARARGPLADIANIIVLQNKGTASASEILASFLQESGRAEVWGTPSRGKGSVQKLLQYSNGGVLKITVAKWLTPNGNWINETGVIPDEDFEERTPEQFRSGEDPLLDKAVREILNR